MVVRRRPRFGSDGFASLKFPEDRFRHIVPLPLLSGLIGACEAFDDPGLFAGLRFRFFAGTRRH